MAKRTSVNALAGRVIETVTIWHSDSEGEPPSLEIRCVGGYVFNFEPQVQSVIRASCLSYRDKNGEIANGKRRVFGAVITNPLDAEWRNDNDS